MIMDHTNRGKWSQPSVPHKGWTCSGVEDLEEPSMTCEMCESVEIRYVHHMDHPDYPITLQVGCVCAEHTEEDYTAPRKRERFLRAIARRRGTWKRRRWRTSFDGTMSLNTEGYRLSLSPVAKNTQRGWMVTVEHRSSGWEQCGQRLFASPDEAKDVSLTALLWAKDRISNRPSAN